MSAWTAALCAQSAQVVLVFAIVLALDALVARRGSARLRGALWAALLVKLSLPPDLSSPISIARWFDASVTRPLPPAVADEAAGVPALALGLAVVWVIGCAACLCVALRRVRSAREQWLASAREAPAALQRTWLDLLGRTGTRRAPALRVRGDAIGPATVGLFRPVIVVPAALLASSAQLEHVLLHELAHARRRDGLRSLAWTLARCAYWFHPFVHVAARRAALVRELACDEFAALHGTGGTSGYRRTLLELARPLVASEPAFQAFGGAGGAITARIERLGRPLARTRRFDVLPLAAFAVLCACCVPLGAVDAARRPHLPALHEVQGCMRKRLLLMAELARRSEENTDARVE